MKRNNDELMLFSGTANLPLAKKVAKYLKRPLNKIDIKHFPDGETFCQVQEGVRGRDVFVIQSGSPSPNEAYMELFVIMDALKRGSAARITAVIPYYGYARQDRKDQPRVPITARLVANLLEAAGADVDFSGWAAPMISAMVSRGGLMMVCGTMPCSAL